MNNNNNEEKRHFDNAVWTEKVDGFVVNEKNRFRINLTNNLRNGILRCC